jgi:hypothetical protein
VDKVKQHFEEITDAWRLYRKYAGIRMNEQDKWDSMVADAVTIQNRHNNSPFVMRAVMMFMELLQEEAKCID